LYLWNGTAYSYVSDLSGSQGITGPQGERGYTGSILASVIGSFSTPETVSIVSINSLPFTPSRVDVLTTVPGPAIMQSNSITDQFGISHTHSTVSSGTTHLSVISTSSIFIINETGIPNIVADLSISTASISLNFITTITTGTVRYTAYP